MEYMRNPISSRRAHRHNRSRAPIDEMSARGRAHMPGRGRGLFWQVFLPNALILGIAVAVLTLSPVSVSRDVSGAQAALLGGALVAMVLVNLALIRRAVRPLEHLARVMAAIDPLYPGHRVAVSTSVSEVEELADVFNVMLDRLEAERRDSGRRMLSAQERERMRLARELHDEIGQSLTGLMLEIDHVARQVDADTERHLREVQETARGLSDEVRSIVRRLRPEALDDLGLRSALIDLAQGFERLTGLAIRRDLDADLPPLDPDVELVIYRIAQESLTNVARHADASQVELALERGAGEVVLRVGDDGGGLDGAAPGSGMKGMLERSLLIGASVDFHPRAGGGSEVLLRVPLEAGRPRGSA